MTSTGSLLGKSIELMTDGIAYGGDAVGRYEGLVVFVPLAAPNERLQVRITEQKKSYARGVIERILGASPDRRDPFCKYFGECGGCQLQHLAYEAQLSAKARFISEPLRRIGGIDWARPIEIRHASELVSRSRARIQVNPKKRTIGFKRAKSNDICDVDECPVLVPELGDLLYAIRRAVKQGDAIDVREFEIAASAGRVAVLPPIPGFPAEELECTIGGITYGFSPDVFFQSNAVLLEALIREVASPYSGNVAVDLYAGVGLFTVPLSRSFREVIAIESNSAAARFAVSNLLRNCATNAAVQCKRVEDVSLNMKPGSLDLLVLDPPRTGAAGAIPIIRSLRPSRVVYVSCDPVTFARDVKSLVELYEITSLTGFDLFPQTYHVETVAHLELASSR